MLILPMKKECWCQHGQLCKASSNLSACFMKPSRQKRVGYRDNMQMDGRREERMERGREQATKGVRSLSPNHGSSILSPLLCSVHWEEVIRYSCFSMKCSPQVWSSTGGPTLGDCPVQSHGDKQRQTDLLKLQAEINTSSFPPSRSFRKVFVTTARRPAQQFSLHWGG